MDLELLKLAASIGGVGGLMAVIMFLVYTRDRKDALRQVRDDRKFMEERMDKVILAYDGTVKENTRVLSELYTYLKAKNGSK